MSRTILDILDAVSDIIPPKEIEFARFLYSFNPFAPLKEIVAGMALMHFHAEGHIAIDQETFTRYESRKLLGIPPVVFSELEPSDLIGTPGELKPLLLDDNLLYFQKYWKYEQEFANWMLQKSKKVEAIREEDLHFINGLFTVTEEPDFQRIAVKLALTRELVVISGGPGTGKTYTVSKILEAYRHIHGIEKIIALAAPTGKAAQRINDSLANSIDALALEPATTIHALLKAQGNTGRFLKNQDHPLEVDLLVVDEASMLDLNLWIALKRALPEHAKLIILGDRFQLASVEAGSILGDICYGSDNYFSHQVADMIGEKVSVSEQEGLNNSIITLTKSHRFTGGGGIHQLAEAIKDEDAEGAMDLLKSEEFPEIKMAPYSIKEEILQNFIIQPYKELTGSINPFEQFNAYRILCALRVGKTGTMLWNTDAENWLRHQFNIPKYKQWYDGRPILITRNNNSLGLRNGEVGIYRESENEIMFDGKEGGVNPSRISDYEPAFCLTIHKSQGSEYDNVAIILPDKENNVLTKELLYTAVTRARQSVLIVGLETIIKSCILNPTKRNSGLKKKFWGHQTF